MSHDLNQSIQRDFKKQPFRFKRCFGVKSPTVVAPSERKIYHSENGKIQSNLDTSQLSRIKPVLTRDALRARQGLDKSLDKAELISAWLTGYDIPSNSAGLSQELRTMKIIEEMNNNEWNAESELRRREVRVHSKLYFVPNFYIFPNFLQSIIFSTLTFLQILGGTESI